MNEDSFKENETNTEMFYTDLKSKIDYHLIENDLTFAEVIGTIEIIKQEILGQMYEDTFIVEMLDEDDDDFEDC
jgi:hypothetical protein